MFKFSALAASALLALGLSSAAMAQDVSSQFQGIVIVPASAPPAAQQASANQSIYDMNLTGQAFPQFKRAKIVAYASSKKAGSIIIDTKAEKLFLILGNGQAAMYRVATAKPGFEWAGTNRVSNKVEWPDWRPPVEMLARRPELPTYMAGGDKNPLGARAIYLGDTIYRIHGTNEPGSIGHAASSGCIRMLNDDVSELYQFVKIGTEVTVM